MIRRPPIVLFVGLGALVALVGVFVAWIVARGIAPPIAPAAAALPLPVPAVAEPAPQASAAPEGSSFEILDPPVVPIDSLPVASARGQAPGVAAPSKGMGHVALAVAPGWCVVTIDGQPRGPSPVPTLSLTVGLHRVTCTPPGGRTRSMTVSAVEGVLNRYKFDLTPQ
jgi:hypothetical protein